MSGPQSPRSLHLPFRWADAEGVVRVEIRENRDPLALGCPELARGFPYCWATVEPPMIGYTNFLGWVQLTNLHWREGEFEIDPFLPIGLASYPFAFHGWAPTLFDAPHTDEDWDFLAHSFLCGLGGELHDLRYEARAILGFSWGFSKRGAEVEFFDLEPLAAVDWDAHYAYLVRTFPEWTFAPGFSEHPLS